MLPTSQPPTTPLPHSFGARVHLAAQRQQQPTATPTMHTRASGAPHTGGGGAAPGKPTRRPTSKNAAVAAATPTPASQRTTVYRSGVTSRPLVRTLDAVLQALIGSTLRCELKNGGHLRGRLTQLDRTGGHLTLAECTLTRANRHAPGVHQTQIESLFVPGRSLLYVHLPDRCDVKSTLTKWESGQDDRLLQFRRRKRQGKFTTREEQERQIDAKERKLAADIERERRTAVDATQDSAAPSPIAPAVATVVAESSSAGTLATANGTRAPAGSDGPLALDTDGSDNHTPDAKRQKR